MIFTLSTGHEEKEKQENLIPESTTLKLLVVEARKIAVLHDIISRLNHNSPLAKSQSSHVSEEK